MATGLGRRLLEVFALCCRTTIDPRIMRAGSETKNAINSVMADGYEHMIWLGVIANSPSTHCIAFTRTQDSTLSSSISVRPRSWISARWSPRAINVTSCPIERASLPATLRSPRSYNANSHGGSLSSANVFRGVPMPSMMTSTTDPGRMDSTPREVPHAITSPGNKVISRDNRLTMRQGGKIMSAAR
jgi:hypothetical protein